MPSEEYIRQVGADAGRCARPPTSSGATEPAGVAAAVEFVLEGLHLTKKLNKDVQAGRYRYRG